MRRCAFVIASLLIANAPIVAQEPDGDDKWALIVGVSGYHHINRSLAGPRNDVTLLTNTLIDEGVPRSHIRVLGDALEYSTFDRKVQADGLPSKEAILGSLDWLVTSAKPGSQVLVYLSGHGTQFPTAVSAEEPDGFDEVFLPIDARPVEGIAHHIPNSISDNEFKPKLAALLKAGASVWFIADACHSGTLSRAGELGRTGRYVDPISLGVPKETIDDSRRNALALNRATENPSAFDFGPSSNFIGFYAVQPDQIAFESPLPRSVPPQQRRAMGEFTWDLIAALRAGGQSDYQTIARRILTSRASSTHDDVFPMFEGALLRTPMYGSGLPRGLPLSAANGILYVGAGAADGIETGSRIEIHDTKTNGRVVGIGAIVETGLDRSRLNISDASADVDNTLTKASGGSRQDLARLSLRVTEQAPSFSLRVASPKLLPGSASHPQDAAVLAATVTSLNALLQAPVDRQPVALEHVADDALADVYPYVAGARVWFFRRGDALQLKGAGDPYSLAGSQLSNDTLRSSLRVIGKHINLLRLLDAVKTSDLSRKLDARLYVSRAQASNAGACAPFEGDEAKSIPKDATELRWSIRAAIIKPCDIVYLEIINTSELAIDVSPLYVDAWGQISFLRSYTGSEKQGMRIEPRKSRIVSYYEDLSEPAQAVGAMHLLVLAVQAGPASSLATKFDRLETTFPILVRDAGSGTSFGSLIDKAGFANGSVRSGLIASNDATGGGLIIPLTTQTR